jgi:hypothetical protein
MVFKLKILTLLSIIFITISCGHKKSPTGGPIDNERPKILYTSPLEFEQIENNEIIISFSKIMDKTSVLSGLSIHPPILNKKIIWKKNDLHIIIYETLKINENITVSLNKSIKCERNNELLDHYIFIFKNGELNKEFISGYINFEDGLSTEYPIHINLLDSDSLLVLNKITNDNNYRFDYLNSGKYTLNAYADINNNNRFDFSIDAFFSRNISIPTTENINIFLTVSDTIKPVVKIVEALNKNNLIITFNKVLAKQPINKIFDDSTGVEVSILHQEMIENKLYILCSDLIEKNYKIEVGALLDKKENANKNSIYDLLVTNLEDNEEILVINSIPKNGDIVYDKESLIQVTFNKIMFSDDIIIKLLEIETNKEIELYSLNKSGFTITYKAKKPYNPFNSYQLNIKQDSKDVNQNQMIEDYISQFIYISY